MQHSDLPRVVCSLHVCVSSPSPLLSSGVGLAVAKVTEGGHRDVTIAAKDQDGRLRRAFTAKWTVRPPPSPTNVTCIIAPSVYIHQQHLGVRICSWTIGDLIPGRRLAQLDSQVPLKYSARSKLQLAFGGRFIPGKCLACLGQRQVEYTSTASASVWCGVFFFFPTTAQPSPVLVYVLVLVWVLGGRRCLPPSCRTPFFVLLFLLSSLCRVRD